MSADITSLVFVSLERIVSEDMKIKFVKMQAVKVNPAFLDILDSVDIFLNTNTASLVPSANSNMKPLIVWKIIWKYMN